MSAKKALKSRWKSTTSFNLKDKWNYKKEELGQMKRDFQHKPPAGDNAAQEEMLEQQRLAQAGLDEEENRRRKRFLSAAQGIRAYTGSSMFRAKPADRAGVAASSSSAIASAASGRTAARTTAGGRYNTP